MARTTAAATTEDAPAATGPLTPEAAGRWLSDLFEQHGRMVYGVCRILLRDPQDAEDASQQTFLSAHRSLLAGTTPRDPAAWLGTIARNECRERLRARAQVPLALVGDPAAPVPLEDVAGGREEVEALCVALAELPHQQREAIVLREFYGLSYEEVRAALGVSDAAVESLIFRARKRLQKELRPARVASGALALPVALHDSLAHAIPGFADGAHRAGILAKLASAPLAAKLAAATVTVTVAGTLGTTAIERRHRAPAPSPPVAARAHAPKSHSRTADLVSTPSVSSANRNGSGENGQDEHASSSSGGRDTSRGDQDDAGDVEAVDEDQGPVADNADEGSASSGPDGGDAGRSDIADESESAGDSSADGGSGDTAANVSDGGDD
jgi:RNA polymerase sigma-70 factor (ECF subfamily)